MNADMVVMNRYHLRFQDLPGICLRKLSALFETYERYEGQGTVPIQPVLGRGFRSDEDTVAGRDLDSSGGHQLSHVGPRLRARPFGPWTKNSRERLRLHHHRRRTGEFHRAASAFVNPAIYIPMHAYQQAVPGASADYLTSRKNRSVVLLGRLKPGVSVTEAQSELRTIAGAGSDGHGAGLQWTTILDAANVATRCMRVGSGTPGLRSRPGK
jgi:hypothetical protein